MDSTLRIEKQKCEYRTLNNSEMFLRRYTHAISYRARKKLEFQLAHSPLQKREGTGASFLH